MAIASPTLKAYLANAAAASTSGRGSGDRIAAVQGGAVQNGGVGHSGFSRLDGMPQNGTSGQRGLDRLGSVQAGQSRNSGGVSKMSKSLSNR